MPSLRDRANVVVQNGSVKGPIVSGAYFQISPKDLESKPLPRLPPGWSRIRHEIALLLRTLGLGIVVTTWQGLFNRTFIEPTKAAIIRNRLTASLRALIHAIPVAFALMEIILNWRGFYVGKFFDKQTVIQFAAKAHEITILASLTALVLSYLRHQLTRKLGRGLPFGALLSGMQFVQINYLWSIEFWASISSRQFPIWKKLNFVALISVSTFLAATCGPSSANLLIPRQDLWPIDPAYLFINATFDDLWPSHPNSATIPENCSILVSGSPAYDRGCPLDDLTPMVEDNILLPEKMFDIPKSTITLSFEDIGTIYDKVFVSSLCPSSTKDQYCATSLHEALLAGIVDPLTTKVATDRNPEARDSSRYLDLYSTIQQNYYQPYTVGSCLTESIKASSNQTLLRFPRISETESELQDNRKVFSITNPTANEVLGSSRNNSRYSVTWTELPSSTSGTPTIGAILVHPQDPAGLTNITTCSLSAGWGSSKLMHHSLHTNNVFSQMMGLPSSWHTILHTEDTYGFIKQDTGYFANLSGITFPQHRINITSSWAKFINPQVCIGANQTTTLVDKVLSGLTDQPSESYISTLLSILLAAGLSRISLKSAYKISGSNSPTNRFCDECLVFEVERSVYGWAYMLDGTATKLAIAVMFIYCLLASSHTLYAIITGISSSAWDSVAELVALAINSSPSDVLQNTCAGIIGTRAFKAPVRIAETTEGHLELLFGDRHDLQTSEFRVNEKYGGIAGLDVKDMKVD